MIDIEIKMLIGAGNGLGNPRPERDTGLLQLAMPVAISLVESAHDRGVGDLVPDPDLPCDVLVAAAFLILSRDAIDLLTEQSEPISNSTHRSVCGWCKRASADVEAVIALSKYTEAEHVEHVLVCEHNPLVGEAARLRVIATRIADAAAHCRSCRDCGDGPCCTRCDVEAASAALVETL